MDILPELILRLQEITRGGKVRLVPSPLLIDLLGGPPTREKLVAALMSIYRDSRIPLRQVTPQSWVAARIDAQEPLVISHEAAGAAVTVLANGNIYAGEVTAGMNDWQLGNILDGSNSLHWERLDPMAEIFSSTDNKPSECQFCDWRYRCGGVDSSVLLLRELQKNVGVARWKDLFQLYCAPRKALFEEALWDSVLPILPSPAPQNPKNYSTWKRLESHSSRFTLI